MGRRSNFERIPKDRYETVDKRASRALLPFIPDNVTYYEPCCASGKLIEQFNEHRIRCVGYSDIDTGVDALTLESQHLNDADLLITNPPFTRQLLHALIYHLSALKPTWLLIDSNWAHTAQASEIITKLCTDEVMIGRLIWIEGTKTAGKEDHSWFRFSTDKAGPMTYHPKNVNK